MLHLQRKHIFLKKIGCIWQGCMEIIRIRRSSKHIPPLRSAHHQQNRLRTRRTHGRCHQNISVHAPVQRSSGKNRKTLRQYNRADEELVSEHSNAAETQMGDKQHQPNAPTRNLSVEGVLPPEAAREVGERITVLLKYPFISCLYQKAQHQFGGQRTDIGQIPVHAF